LEAGRSVLSLHFRGGNEDTTNSLSHDSRYPGRVSNREPPEYKTKAFHYSILLGSKLVTAGKKIKEQLPHYQDMGKWRYSSLHSHLMRYMKVSFMTPTLHPRRRDAGTHWRPDGPHVRSEIYGEKKNLCFQKSNPSSPVVQPVV
jgi:hypothetical protein